MRIGLFLLTLSLATVGCRKPIMVTSSATVTAPDTLLDGMVIRSAGNWSASTANGSKRLDIKVNGNAVSWVISNEDKHPAGGIGGSMTGEASTTMTLSSAGDPWFVFVESPQRLWYFNGKDRLSYRLSGSAGIRGGVAVISGKLTCTDETIPLELITLLPTDLQKLFPADLAPIKRPAF